MPLLVHKDTIKLYKKLKALGGEWDKEAKGWQMPKEAMAQAMALLDALPPPKPKVPRELQAAYEAVNAGYVVQAVLVQNLRRIQEDLVAPELEGVELGGIDVDNLVFGHHECATSPTVTCVYDDRNDPRHDDCIFCHEPRDRG